MIFRRIYENRILSRIFFLFILSGSLLYIILYTLNIDEFDPEGLDIQKTSVKCINKICVEYFGITECIDIVDSYIFKVSFNENFNIKTSDVTYSVNFQSLGKKCAE